MSAAVQKAIDWHDRMAATYAADKTAMEASEVISQTRVDLYDALAREHRASAAFIRAIPTDPSLIADTIVRVNAFLTYMADRYRERTSRRVLGIRLHAFTREQAMDLALATFDAQLALTQIVFGDPAYGWERDHANELVDEDLQHWEP